MVQHSEPVIEAWEVLTHDWQPVHAYCETRIAECLWKLASSEQAPNMETVAALRREINVLKEFAQLPEVQFSRLGAANKHNKEAKPHGR